MSDRDRRALMFLGAALGLFLILQLDFFAPSAGGSVIGGDTLQALEERLRLAQVQARQKPLTEAERQEASALLSRREQRLLDAADAALAQAEMQSIAEQLLADEGLTMSASRFAAVELEQESYAQAPLVIDFTCQIEQLVNLMAAIANAPKLLTTRSIRIQPEKPETKSVRVQMTIAGYLPAERTPELTRRNEALTNGGGL
jgi:Tfp pilus assembly protein PilO